jgi:hypothetical protein
MRLVNKKLHDLIRDAPLEPIGTKSGSVEEQLAAWTVGRRAKVMRCRAKLHGDFAVQILHCLDFGEICDLPHSGRPFRFWNPIPKYGRSRIIFSGPHLQSGRDLAGG